MERLGRAFLIPVQSIVGDRGPFDPPNTESVFTEALQIWRNPVFAGLVETAARREAEENSPPWVLKKVSSRKSARVHEYLLTEKGRQLYPVLVALVKWGNALAEEEAQPSIHEHAPCGRQRE